LFTSAVGVDLYTIYSYFVYNKVWEAEFPECTYLMESIFAFSEAEKEQLSQFCFPPAT